MTDDEQNEWRAHQIERATKILAGDPDAGLVAMASHTMDRLKRAESRLRALDLGIRGARSVPVAEVRPGDVGVLGGTVIMATGPATESGLPVVVLQSGVADTLLASTFRWIGHVPDVERSTIGEDDADRRIERLLDLLADTLRTAERRTRERDEALARLRAHRVDAELGHALRSLDDAVGRLRRAKPCPTMGFAPADPIDNAKSMIREIDELLAEDAGSADARSEVRDVITVALNLAQAHGLDLASGLLEQAELNARVDALEAGQTWTEAKAAERKAVAAGCSTCEHHWFRFNGGVGATTCGLLGHRIVAYGTTTPAGRPAECPLTDHSSAS